jgi:DNA-binding MarR family transcriptional regulator
MKEDSPARTIAYEFVLKHIDSVPQLEALLLLWDTRPRVWSVAEVAARIYVAPDTVRAIMQDLARQQLISCSSEEGDLYCCVSTSEDQNRVLEAVSETYRQEIVPISSMIHSKASRAVRDFARAFRFTKDRD